MKYTVIALLSFCLILGCTEGERGVRIEGKLKNPIAGATIQLQEYGDSGIEIRDSTVVDDGGNFVIYADITETTFLRVNIANRQFVNLILKGDEGSVSIEADGTSTNARTAVQGSPDTDLMEKMDSAALKRQSDIQLLTQESRQARSTGDVKTLNDINEQWMYLAAKHNKNMRGLIWESLPSLAALYGVNYIDVEVEYTFADSLVQFYAQSLPDHPFTKELAAKVSGISRVSIGADAPEISLPSTDGEVISLSSLRGKYVLIDFWAAWCRPCRMENPNVRRLYSRYKNENFEIYAVSLDRTKEAWLKAIEDDQLPWIHVSDLKYFNSAGARAYNVSAIPATYLIGPDGKIVAKGLRGPSLQAKLAELFGA